MIRGDLVTVALPGDFGKPRPALIVQSDLFQDHPTISLLPITSHLVAAPLLRIDIGPGFGLDRPCQIQIDKLQTIRRERIGQMIGRVPPPLLLAVTRAMALFLGLA